MKNIYLVFGGSYGNLQATRALFAVARSRAIPSDRVFFTGDAVAYCAEPNETVRLLKDWGVRAIQGNVEEQLIAGREDCGCGFVAGSVCDSLAGSWYAFLQSELSAESLAWMRGLPKILHLNIAGRRIAVVHGAFSGISTYVFRSTPWEVKQAELTAAGAEIILAGHCGLPFLQKRNQQLWANAGAIGLPANDGTARSWYMTITESEGQLEFKTHPLEFSGFEAANAMKAKGLPSAYAMSLGTGIWPSCEILLPLEAQEQGRPLSPESLEI